MYVYMYVHYVCMYTRTHVCMYAYIYTCMYLWMTYAHTTLTHQIKGSYRYIIISHKNLCSGTYDVFHIKNCGQEYYHDIPWEPRILWYTLENSVAMVTKKNVNYALMFTFTYTQVKPYIKEIYRLINLTSDCHTVVRTISGYHLRKNSHKNKSYI